MGTPRLHSDVRRWRLLTGVSWMLTVLLTGLLWHGRRGGALPQAQTAGVGDGPVSTAEPVPAEPPSVHFERADFDDLPGWRIDPVAAALPALLASCRRLAPVLSADGVRGFDAASWGALCADLRALREDDGDGLREVLERRTEPWSIQLGDDDEGLTTGYFEPLLRGSRRRHGRYQVPLYRRPPELVAVDLGRFRDALAGQRLAGVVRGGVLEPYHDREAIVAGAIGGRALEVVWVDDAVDAFFLQIQGSGRILLDDGGVVRLGYEAQNGHPYVAIGRELVARGALPLELVTLQSIRDWLRSHPEEAPGVMAVNRSFVFFRELEEAGPVGSHGVVLTPGRSLAVDRQVLPLGVPVWLAGRQPAMRAGEPDPPLQRLVVAQDTGGAIRGALRGDLFWGSGDLAAEVAGRMKHAARWWVLLPRAS